MNLYEKEYVELEYGGIFVYKNTITLELFEADTDTEIEKLIQIKIGDIEATNIMLAAEQDIFDFLPTDTFDLFIESLNKFNIRICGIVILQEENGIWKSQIELINTITNETTYIECRTTDAIILSFKEDLPIMIDKKLMEKHQKKYKDILKDYNESSENIENIENIKNSSPDNLEKLLQKHIKNENYEEAAKLKKIIDKIKGGK